uniref:Uncharacterized protein n=1 Tax=Amanita bisporigera TaxID=87325 RepID=A0A5Q0N221_AMABI|nr:hypothetical protein [Amanita bisporigera]QFZ98564.1 hypothetical protein [Amanita bisporigera]
MSSTPSSLHSPKLPGFDNVPSSSNLDEDKLPGSKIKFDKKTINSLLTNKDNPNQAYADIDYDAELKKMGGARSWNESKYLDEYDRYGIEFTGSHNEAQAILRKLKLRDYINSNVDNSPKDNRVIEPIDTKVTIEEPFNPHLALIESLNNRTKLTEQLLEENKDLSEGSVFWNPNTNTYVLYTEGKFELASFNRVESFNTGNSFSNLSTVSPEKAFETLSLPNSKVILDRPELGIPIETNDTSDLSELQIILKKIRLVKGEGTVRPSDIRKVQNFEIDFEPLD